MLSYRSGDLSRPAHRGWPARPCADQAHGAPGSPPGGVQPPGQATEGIAASVRSRQLARKIIWIFCTGSTHRHRGCRDDGRIREAQLAHRLALGNAFQAGDQMQRTGWCFPVRRVPRRGTDGRGERAGPPFPGGRHAEAPWQTMTDGEQRGFAQRPQPAPAGFDRAEPGEPHRARLPSPSCGAEIEPAPVERGTVGETPLACSRPPIFDQPGHRLAQRPRGCVRRWRRRRKRPARWD